MQVLMTVILIWLSVNFGLPATFELPRVVFASSETMAHVRAVRSSSENGQHPAPSTLAADLGAGGHVFAMYDDATRTIYLPLGWNILSAADGSMLVHEMVHHLQNVAGMAFACAGAREKDAYRAQESWLAVHGQTLEGTFGVDPMTVLVRTNCMN